MSPQKFKAHTAREALAQVRAHIGPDALILNNESTTQGVVITAIAEDDLSQMQLANAPLVSPEPDRNTASEPIAPPIAETPAQAHKGENATADTPMSTVNFQSFANERHARLQAESTHTIARSERTQTAVTEHRSTMGLPSVEHDLASDDNYMRAMIAELRQMRGFIRQQFSALAWVDGVRRTPAQARLLKTMIQSGFSSTLARAMVSRAPNDLDESAADRWLHDGLVRNLRVACFESGQLQAGGVFALVGPTGVGKTTSAAKIAARFAQIHGPEAVGLISADVYRIAAQEQLARYGQLIGSKTLTAHDAQELSELLVRLQDKKLVLIDTAGLSQKDPRVDALLDCIDQGPVKRMIVVSAAAQSEAIEETLSAYQAYDSAGVILTKTDEACRLGGALDTLIRHRLPLHAIGTGQQVPEDWMPADPDELISAALSVDDRHQTPIPDIDLTMLMQRIGPTPSTDPQAQPDLESVSNQSMQGYDHA